MYKAKVKFNKPDSLHLKLLPLLSNCLFTLVHTMTFWNPVETFFTTFLCSIGAPNYAARDNHSLLPTKMADRKLRPYYLHPRNNSIASRTKNKTTKNKYMLTIGRTTSGSSYEALKTEIRNV